MYYSPITDTSDRLIDLQESDDYSDLTSLDSDLTDEPILDYHKNDYDKVVRSKRGIISDILSTGKDISMAGGWIKDFVFSLTGPIFKSLNRDQNVHATKGLTRPLISQTGLGSHHRGGANMQPNSK